MVAIVVCSVLGVIAAAVLLSCCALRRRRRQQGDPSISASSLPSSFGIDPTTSGGGGEGLKSRMSKARVASEFDAVESPAKNTNNECSSYQRLLSSPSSPPPSSLAAGGDQDLRPPLTPPLRLRDRKLLPSLLLGSYSTSNKDEDSHDPFQGNLSKSNAAHPHASLSSSLYSSRHTSSQKSSDIIPMTSTNTIVSSKVQGLGLAGFRDVPSFPSSPICAPMFNKLEPRQERMLQSSHYITTGSFSSLPVGLQLPEGVGSCSAAAAAKTQATYTRLRSPPPVTFNFPPRGSIGSRGLTDGGLSMDGDNGYRGSFPTQHPRGVSSLSSSSTVTPTASPPMGCSSSSGSGAAPTTFGATVVGHTRIRDRYHGPPTSNGYTMATITRRMEEEGAGRSSNTPRITNPFLEEGEEEDTGCSSASSVSSVSPKPSFSSSSPIRPRRPHDEPLEIPDLVSPDNSHLAPAPSSPPPCRALPTVPSGVSQHVPSLTGSMIGIAKTTSTPSSPLSGGFGREREGVLALGLDPSKSTLSLHALAEQHRRQQRGEEEEEPGTTGGGKAAKRRRNNNTSNNNNSRDSWGSWGEDMPSPSEGGGGSDSGSGSSPTTLTGPGKKIFGVLFPPPAPAPSFSTGSN